MNLVIRASLSQELLNRMPIIIPPFEEQIAIAEYLENISAKISKAIGLKEREIEVLKEYKSSLINSAVTGKVKIG
jgi:type I restriction enzyme S subunit